MRCELTFSKRILQFGAIKSRSTSTKNHYHLQAQFCVRTANNAHYTESPGVYQASHKMGTGPVPRVKRPGRSTDHTPATNAVVKERVELCLLNLWAFVACYRVSFTFIMSTTFLGQAAVPHPAKKFPVFHGTWKFITVFTKASHLYLS